MLKVIYPCIYTFTSYYLLQTEILTVPSHWSAPKYWIYFSNCMLFCLSGLSELLSLTIFVTPWFLSLCVTTCYTITIFVHVLALQVLQHDQLFVTHILLFYENNIFVSQTTLLQLQHFSSPEIFKIPTWFNLCIFFSNFDTHWYVQSFIQWLTKLFQCLIILDRWTWYGMMT